jgi:hypothetical protein
MIKRVTVFEYEPLSCRTDDVLHIYTGEISMMNGTCIGVGYETIYVSTSKWSQYVHEWLDALPKLPRGQKECVTICNKIHDKEILLLKILQEREDVRLISYTSHNKLLIELKFWAENEGRWGKK